MILWVEHTLRGIDDFCKYTLTHDHQNGRRRNPSDQARGRCCRLRSSL